MFKHRHALYGQSSGTPTGHLLTARSKSTDTDMKLVPSLQFPVLWEGFPHDCVGSLPFHLEEHLWGQKLTLRERAWLISSVLVPPSGLWGREQGSVQASQVLLHHTHSAMTSWTLHWGTVMPEQKRASPNCWTGLSRMSWVAEALRFPFTGSVGQRPAPEKQPHSIIPPPQTGNIFLSIRRSLTAR